MNLSKDFWDNKYLSNDIDWDLGKVSTPIKTYIDQLKDKNLIILIPGGGNSYEAEYLHSNGFTNVYVVDVSKTALTNIKKRVPTFPNIHLVHSDFFDLKMSFDLIIEQTFFCAINPSLRSKYVLKMNGILNAKGKIVGLLFNIPLYSKRPPYGGNKEEYMNYFEPYFKVQIMEECYNSVDNRKGKELFIKLLKTDLGR